MARMGFIQHVAKVIGGFNAQTETMKVIKEISVPVLGWNPVTIAIFGPCLAISAEKLMCGYINWETIFIWGSRTSVTTSIYIA